MNPAAPFRLLRDAPIRRKLTLLTLVASGCALVVACAGFVAYDQISFRESLARDLGVVARITGANSAAALSFNDAGSARQTLATLAAQPRVVSACVYDADGVVFATYTRRGVARLSWPQPVANIDRFVPSALEIFRPIELAGETIGTIYVASDLQELRTRIARYLVVVIVVMLVATLAAVLAASRLQRFVSEPISHLAAVAAHVATGRDYATRARKHGNDELGSLIDVFNDMLAQIESRDRDLETRVAARTRELEQENAERKHAEDRLAHSLSLLHGTLESTADGILVVDNHGHATVCNRKFAEMWGLPRHIVESGDDALALSFVAGQLKHPDAFRRKVAELYRQPDAESFDLLELADGRTFERHSQPQRVNGVNVGRVWSFRDVTSRHTLEAQLRQAQKMEVVGQLAGGIAHDFNNILTAMMLSLELLRDEQPLPPGAALPLADLNALARRAARLTEQLLLFGRKHVMRTERLDLNVQLGNVLKMLRRLLGEHILVDFAAGSAPLWIEADSGMLDQVVMNLCVNARDAMPAGGTITIVAEPVTLTGELGAHPEGRAGPFACVRVTDAGCGMTPEVLAHAFEPFFTTKPLGKGTGLGLATVHGIVHQHRGWIEVDSSVGRGTTFRVYLPLAGFVPPHSRAPLPPDIPRGSETILFVEDEEILRRITSDMLLRLGYHVLTAADGEEALVLWRQHLSKIDLLLTDMVMPNGISGLALAQMLATTKPDLRVIIVSGYTPDAASREALAAAKAKFLAKPFEFSALADTVRRCLD